jgi:hypothetical protein
LQQWRRARKPEDVPGLAALPGSARHQPVLRREDVAALTGVSERHYRRLEQGASGYFSTVFLRSVGRVLGLGEDQLAALYIARGHVPPRRAGAPEVDEPLLQHLHEQQHAAYISDPAWDVLAYNERATRVFPWMAQPDCNIMSWSLGRESRWQLHDWRNAWAPPMLAQLRMAALSQPDNERLQKVAQGVRTDPEVDHLWETLPSAQAHPYGDVRPLWLPTHREDRPVMMRIMAFAPLRDTGLRLILMVPAEPVDIGG